jgi:hypothetical protein
MALPQTPTEEERVAIVELVGRGAARDAQTTQAAQQQASAAYTQAVEAQRQRGNRNALKAASHERMGRLLE